MIELEQVEKRFGPVEAVGGVSAELGPRGITALLGPNGAGKTTLIRMITGFLSPTRGRVRVGGHDTVMDSARARANLGYLPEAAPLYPEMSAAGYVGYRAGLMGLRGRARRGAVDEAVARCWLEPVRTRRIGALSKGYRQRVALAAALVHRPGVLVLDEPSSGLDPEQIVALRALVRELSQTCTVLLSSHILPEVERACDRLLIMARGRVRADGAPGALLAGLEAERPYRVEMVGPEPAEAWTEAARRALAETAGVARVRLAEMSRRAGADGDGGERGWTARARFEVMPAAGAGRGAGSAVGDDAGDDAGGGAGGGPGGDAGEVAVAMARGLGALARSGPPGLVVSGLARTPATLEDLFMRVIDEGATAGREGSAGARGSDESSERAA